MDCCDTLEIAAISLAQFSDHPPKIIVNMTASHCGTGSMPEAAPHEPMTEKDVNAMASLMIRGIEVEVFCC